MHKIVVLYPPPRDREAFARYYRETHLPLARRLPGVIEMGYALDLDGDDGPYYAMFEATFASSEAAAAAMGSPEGRAVEADVPNYATGGAVVLGVPWVGLEITA
jgi:uncharacterized protein (TIGR02118 family)